MTYLLCVPLCDTSHAMPDHAPNEGPARAASLAAGPVLSAYEQVARRLRELILTGQLPPGQRLPTEDELARDFAVSRATIREALRMLSAQQLIRTTKGPHGGSQVTVPSADHIAQVLESSFTLLAQVDRVSLDELLEARRVLEVPAARMAAARNGQAAAHDTLKDLLGPGPADATREDHFVRNQRFHATVLDLCGNRVMTIAAQPIFVVLQRHLVRADEAGDLQRGIDEQHRRIGEAILAGEEEAAEREMHEHLDFLRPRYERVWRERSRAH